MRCVHGPSVALLVLAAVLFGGSVLLRQESETLRAEIGFLEREQRELAGLHAEQERLRALQVPEPELQRLRNDRAALTRLRNEIAQLEESAERLSRAASEPVAEPRASFRINVTIKAGGGVEVEGLRMDDTALRQLFTSLARQGEPVEIRFGSNPLEVPRWQMTDAMTRVIRLGKEVGMPLSVRFPTIGASGK